jgi:hypothetical protein
VLRTIKRVRGSKRCSAENGHLIMLLISVQQAKKDEKSIFISKMLRGFSTISLSMKNNAKLNSVQVRACLNNIKFRNEIHMVVRHGKSANNDIQEAESYISEYAQINQYLIVLHRSSKSIKKGCSERRRLTKY